MKPSNADGANHLLSTFSAAPATTGEGDGPSRRQTALPPPPQQSQQQQNPPTGLPTHGPPSRLGGKLSANTGRRHDRASASGTSSSSKPATVAAALDPVRYKTRLCFKFHSTAAGGGGCPNGASCIFAHGEGELRTEAMNRQANLTCTSQLHAYRRRYARGVATELSSSPLAPTAQAARGTPANVAPEATHATPSAIPVARRTTRSAVEVGGSACPSLRSPTEAVMGMVGGGGGAAVEETRVFSDDAAAPTLVDDAGGVAISSASRSSLDIDGRGHAAAIEFGHAPVSSSPHPSNAPPTWMVSDGGTLALPCTAATTVAATGAREAAMEARGAPPHHPHYLGLISSSGGWSSSLVTGASVVAPPAAVAELLLVGEVEPLVVGAGAIPNAQSADGSAAIALEDGATVAPSRGDRTPSTRTYPVRHEPYAAVPRSVSRTVSV